MSLQMRRVSIPSRDGREIPGHLTLPPAGRGPGLVLIQEIFGVNAWLRGVAAWFAGRGFVVLCPDFFWRQEPGVELTDRTEAEWAKGVALMRGMDEAMAVSDGAAAADYVRGMTECSGRVGAAGFCLGGRLAYLMAAGNHADACVGYYGVGIERILDRASGMRTPLMLHIAGKDEYCPPAAQEAIARALKDRPGVTVHLYPEQDHAFTRNGGAHYDAGAAELAHGRTLEFLTRHLAG